jgi:hypothetical protein
MKLEITAREEVLLEMCLLICQEELEKVAKTIPEGFISRKFNRDLQDVKDLLTRITNSADSTTETNGAKELLVLREEVIYRLNDKTNGFIDAIRYYRNRTGCYLAEAKKAVEAIRDGKA